MLPPCPMSQTMCHVLLQRQEAVLQETLRKSEHQAAVLPVCPDTDSMISRVLKRPTDVPSCQVAFSVWTKGGDLFE